MEKLVIFHPALAPYRVDFFNLLSKKFNSQFYFSNENVRDQKFDQQLLRSQCNFQFKLLNRGFELGNRSIRFGIFNLLNNEKPNIVICSEYSQITITIILIKIILKKNYKIYIISDDSIDLSVKRKGIRKWLRDKSSNYISGIIFPSLEVCEWYNKNVNKKTTVFELPIVHSNNIFRSKLKESILYTYSNIAKFKLEGKKVLLYVGRLVPVKNVSFLLEALSKSISHNLVLLIVGDGEDIINLKTMSNDLNINDKVIFAGRFEGLELISWYNISEYFILPSYYEPYGAVVNEALLSGCKVLCSNLAGASTLINDQNGRLFDPFDNNELVRLLEDIVFDMKEVSVPITVKPDLMSFDFNEKVHSLISKL